MYGDLPTGSERSTLHRFRAHVDLVHPIPILIVLIATLALSFVIVPEGNLAVRFWLLLSMLGGQLAVGAVNELADLEIDRASGRAKPLVTGAVTSTSARAILVAGVVLMVSASIPLGLTPLLLCSLGNGIGIVYSLWFKQSLFAWVPYVLAVPLIPIWISSAFGNVDYHMLLLFPLGLCAVLSVQIAQSLPDVEADRVAGLDSVTTRLGAARSLLLCWGALCLSLVLVWFSSERNQFSNVALGIVLVGVVSHATLCAIDRERGIKLAFPLTAVGTLLLGLAWLS